MSDPKGFRVTPMPALTLAMSVLLRRAAIFGHSDRLAAFLEWMQIELATRPLEWGEPTHELKTAKMVVCLGFHDRVRVEYLVHPDTHEVFVTVIEPQPGHPLYVPPDA